MRRVAHLVIVSTAMIAAGLLAGCCPGFTDYLVLGGQETPSPETGSYWVEMRNGQLHYFELPEERNVSGRWIALGDDLTDWFDGPAFYLYSAEKGWSRDPDAEGITLDDVLQLYDPPPAVPES